MLLGLQKCRACVPQLRQLGFRLGDAVVRRRGIVAYSTQHAALGSLLPHLTEQLRLPRQCHGQAEDATGA